MSERFRIGTLRDLHTQPLYRTITSSPVFTGELVLDTPAAHIDRMMAKECDAAFAAPMDYALNSSDLVIVPGIGVSSAGFSGVARLYLRGTLDAIRTMAVGTVSATDVVLARVVLGEKYDSAPAVVPFSGTVEAMLDKADCALVTGDALFGLTSRQPFLDLVDEWSDITELPFVHTIAVMRDEAYSAPLAELLSASQQAGRLELDAVAESLAAERSIPRSDLREFLSRFSYTFDDASRESLETFFQMAFFHGMAGDVADIRFGS